MKKILLIVIMCIASIFFYNITSAQLNQTHTFRTVPVTAKCLSYPDYYPISKITPAEKYLYYEGVFESFIQYLKSYNLSCDTFLEDTFAKTARRADRNGLDIIIGAYSDSALNGDFKFIYPSILDNPVHLVMLPSNIEKISKLKDLQKLKGAIDRHEQWNDFVIEQFKNFDIETLDSSEEMYRKLIDGEIDYVFTSYWYGATQMMKLGIQEFVAMSQKGMWNMPLFVAVSNSSRYKTYFVHLITEILKDPETVAKIKEQAIETLNQIKLQNQGVVPEAYILKKDNN